MGKYCSNPSASQFGLGLNDQRLIVGDIASNPASPYAYDLARAGNQLYHYWRDAGPAFQWNGPYPIGQSGVAGNPVLLQGPFDIYKKNFELVVPLAAGGIAHDLRDNGAPGLPWYGPTIFGTDLGRFEALSMLIDTYTLQPTPPYTMQVVARFQNQLLFYYHDPGPPYRWYLL